MSISDAPEPNWRHLLPPPPSFWGETDASSLQTGITKISACEQTTNLFEHVSPCSEQNQKNSMFAVFDKAPGAYFWLWLGFICVISFLSSGLMVSLHCLALLFATFVYFQLWQFLTPVCFLLFISVHIRLFICGYPLLFCTGLVSFKYLNFFIF